MDTYFSQSDPACLSNPENIRKRLLAQVAGCNLGLLLRHLVRVGTPRSLAGPCRGSVSLPLAAYAATCGGFPEPL